MKNWSGLPKEISLIIEEINKSNILTKYDLADIVVDEINRYKFINLYLLSSTGKILNNIEIKDEEQIFNFYDETNDGLNAKCIFITKKYIIAYGFDLKFILNFLYEKRNELEVRDKTLLIVGEYPQEINVGEVYQNPDSIFTDNKFKNKVCIIFDFKSDFIYKSDDDTHAGIAGDFNLDIVNNDRYIYARSAWKNNIKHISFWNRFRIPIHDNNASVDINQNTYNWAIKRCLQKLYDEKEINYDTILNIPGIKPVTYGRYLIDDTDLDLSAGSDIVKGVHIMPGLQKAAIRRKLGFKPKVNKWDDVAKDIFSKTHDPKDFYRYEENDIS